MKEGMRIRLKIRALLIYLFAVCCGTVLFGTYILNTVVNPALKSHKGIEKTARDNWSDGTAPRKVVPLVNRLGLSSFLLNDSKDNKEHHREQQPVGVNRQVVLPAKQQLLNMSWEELSNLYHSYTQQIQVTCKNIVRLGKVTDGGWEVCEDVPFKPKPPCLVYSFGVGNDFSFDDAVARKYNCDVHSFDPSMKVGDHKRASSVNFHAEGLADFTGKTQEGWKMSVLPQIRSDLHHNEKPLSILKLDIEEWEWRVLPLLLAENHLQNTRQLLMELHQCDGCSVYNPSQLDKEPPMERYITALGIFKDLYEADFRLFWHHQNKACGYISKFGMQERNACCEVHMVRIDRMIDR